MLSFVLVGGAMVLKKTVAKVKSQDKEKVVIETRDTDFSPNVIYNLSKFWNDTSWEHY